MKERNESLDCLKGIAILLVMAGHVQVHNQMTDPYLYDIIKSLQMPLFFLISGYLAGAGSKISNFSQYKSKIKKRAVSYLLPFFSWLCLQHLTYIPRALHTVLFQLDYGLWFLMTLFLFTFMTCTAQLVQAKVQKERAFWFTLLGSCCLVLFAYLANVTFLSPSILIIYLPYYICAYFCGLHPEFIQRWIPEKVLNTAAFSGGVLFLLMAYFLDLVTVTGFFMLGVQTFASFLGCLALIRLVLLWKDHPLKTKLAGLGRHTLEIYVLHYQFATVLNPDRILYSFWSPAGLLYSAAAFAVMSMLTAVFIYIIHRIPWASFFLFGKHA